jgi:DNA polymerase-3 subunit gamma/tau
MAYKALYRKYRPDSFDGVVGQTAIVKTLQNIVRENKISHAYLFSGPRGTGKTSIAKIFARAINCLNPADGMPCGECAICKQIKGDETSDIIEIDAASNNGVDEIRDLKSKVNLAPSSCKYKVYIIDEVHMLSIGAFNALLKTLEEPPQHVVFILATTEMHKLPLTIISRCQNYNFKKITEEQMVLRLSYIVEKEKINIDADALNEIARLSDGGMRDAIGLLEQLCSFTNNKITSADVELLSSSVPRKDIASLLQNVFEGNAEDIFKLNDSFYQSGKDFIKIAEDIVVFLKDTLLYKKAEKYFKKSCNYNFDDFIDLFNKIDENIIYKYISELNKAIADIKISNHPKIIFEITLLKLIDNSTSESKDNVKKLPASTIKQPLENNKLAVEVKNEEKVEKEEIDSVTNTKKNADIESELSNQPDDNVEVDEQVDENSTSDFLPSVSIPLYKKILINNTLAEANKKLLSQMNTKFSDLSAFLINKDSKQAASLLMDGKIVGVSDSNIIFTYQYDAIVDKADAMVSEMEVLITKIANQKFKIINITEANWQDTRPYFVKIIKEKGKIEVMPEIKATAPKANVKHKKTAKEIEDAINMFGEELIEIK